MFQIGETSINMTSEHLLRVEGEIPFARYVMYKRHARFINLAFHAKSLPRPKVIEFGGSNGIIEKLFDTPSYEVAPNYPYVDIQNLSNYKENSWDFIVLDEVLEHVANPWLAISELYRLLKSGGYLITSSPFLVPIHKCPADYWRFTEDGLRVLLSAFQSVEVYSWGNSSVISDIAMNMMMTVNEAKERGIFTETNERKFPITVWAYAQK
jgi:SAM-dependent methyltransferase